MNSPGEHDDETVEPPAGDAGAGGDSENESRETFVRSFSRDRERRDRIPGRTLHHPFATEPADHRLDEPAIEPEGVNSRPSPAEPVNVSPESREVAGEDNPFEPELGEPRDDKEGVDAPSWQEGPDAPATETFSPTSDQVFERISGWEASRRKAATYRWIIRLFFLTVLAVLAFLTYQKLMTRPVDKRAGGNPVFVQDLRNYQFGPPNKHWKRTSNPNNADIVLERANPEGLLWIESGERDGPVPLGKLADETRIAWQQEGAGWIEESSVRAFVAGQEALKLTASCEPSQRKRSAIVLWRQGFWYRISFEAPASDFEAVATECRIAVDDQFRFLRDRRADQRSHPADTKTFHGIAYEYQIDSPGDDWQEDADMTSDSRFADLKLRNASRTASLVVSPRPEATIDKLHDLYLRRQEKLFEGRLSIERDEELRIAGRPAKRLQASIEEDTIASRYLVTTFLQGDGIAYQIETEVNAEQAAEVLPALAIAIESFQVGSAAPMEREPKSADDGRHENHFRKAPDWVSPK